MRRLILGLAISGIAVLAPALALAGEAEDQATALSVKSNIDSSGQLRDYRMKISVKDGIATLQGKVRSQQQVYAAARIAEQTRGVEEVVNNLNVVRLEDETPVTRLTSPATMSKYGPGVDTGVRQTSAQTSARAPKAPVAAQPVANPGYAMPAGHGPPQGMPHGYSGAPMPMMGAAAPGAGPIPAYVPQQGGVSPARFDHPNLPNYAWPAYASHPNYAAVTYPKQYSATAWPYIGPFYPYPQVPLGWRKVTLEWDDGWWFLDFKDRH